MTKFQYEKTPTNEKQIENEKTPTSHVIRLKAEKFTETIFVYGNRNRISAGSSRLCQCITFRSRSAGPKFLNIRSILVHIL